MATGGLGRMLIIANPTAHGGQGESAALFAMRFFSSNHSVTKSCAVKLTEQRGDARAMAQAAADFDTVIALGGDGILHEVANGLMQIPEGVRPTLGVIALGTGNDFAKTFHMSYDDPQKSIAELVGGSTTMVDLGIANGTYFCQTLSFGLDASIALDVDRHRSSILRGSSQYVVSGLKVLSGGIHGVSYRARIGDEVIEGPTLTVAIQNGPTYGGGFRICPEARPDDGLVDICLSLSAPSLAKSIALFGLIRTGRHTKSPHLAFRKAASLRLEFPQQLPTGQMDGEPFAARIVEVGVCHKALRLIIPTTRTNTHR